VRSNSSTVFTSRATVLPPAVSAVEHERRVEGPEAVEVRRIEPVALGG
jgi:hypothetical protein